MFETLKKLVAPPTFGDNKEKNRAAGYLNIILFASAAILIVLLLSTREVDVNVVLFILLMAMAGLQVLLRRGKVKVSATLFMVITWTGMTYLAWQSDGIRDSALLGYLIVIVVANLLGTVRVSLFFTASSIIAFWVLVWADQSGLITPDLDTTTNFARDLSVVFILLQIIVYLTIRNLNDALQKVQQSERELLNRNEELANLQENLENLVEERTSSLSELSKKSQKQSNRLKTISLVAEKISLIQTLSELLPEISRLTSENFDFYHVGIFLISEDGKYAQLRAANSVGGKRMLARNHQLEVGRVGVVGKVADDRTPRISLDVGEDAVYFDNPDLPETHSEMALPLVYGKELLGVLDVQSRRKSAFTEDDLEVFNILANQIAIAIQNTRQLEQTQNALQEMEEISRQYIRQEWSQLRQRQKEAGYRYVQGSVEKITPEQQRESGQAKSTLSIPVKLRDEIIGVLKVRAQENNHTWQKDDLELVQAIADRAALALENARLLENTSRRAGRERLVSEITTKIRSTTDPQEMIATTLKELKKALDVNRVELMPQTPEED